MRVAKVGHLKGTQLSKEPCNDQGNGGGHDQPRGAAESRLAQRLEGSRNVSRLCLAERLDGADVAGEEGKHGDADAALEGQSDKGQLEQLRGGILAVARRPEAVVPSAAQVCYHDPKGSHATNTLQSG